MSRYCVVLLTAEVNKLSKPFEAFLSFALANTQDTVRFVHVYSNRQQEFASTLLPDMEAFHGKSGVSHGPQSHSHSSETWLEPYSDLPPSFTADSTSPCGCRPSWKALCLHSDPVPAEPSATSHEGREIGQPFPAAFPGDSIVGQNSRGPSSKSQATGDVLRNLFLPHVLCLCRHPSPTPPPPPEAWGSSGVKIVVW